MTSVFKILDFFKIMGYQWLLWSKLWVINDVLSSKFRGGSPSHVVKVNEVSPTASPVLLAQLRSRLYPEDVFSKRTFNGRPGLSYWWHCDRHQSPMGWEVLLLINPVMEWSQNGDYIFASTVSQYNETIQGVLLRQCYWSILHETV